MFSMFIFGEIRQLYFGVYFYNKNIYIYSSVFLLSSRPVIPIVPSVKEGYLDVNR